MKANVVPLNVVAINERIDAALIASRRIENLAILMCGAIFVLGMTVIVVGYFARNVYVQGGSVLIQSFLFFPIRSILKIRRENIALQAFPALIDGLSPTLQAREIGKLMNYIRSGKQ